jgi:alkylation response protein AidB-like acyl-CoA dehydrogenase
MPEPPAGTTPDPVALAASLVPRLAERAAAYDEADAFAADDLRDLVDAGYTALTVPAELGGGGAGVTELIAAQAELAKGSPATALAVNMHLHGVGILVESMRDRVEPFLKSVVADGAVLGGGFSEPQSGGNWWHQSTTATRVDGGWRLDGVKTFFTGFPGITHLFLTAAVVTDDGEREPIGFLFPKPESGVRVLGEWKAMGMRATGSNALAIDDLVVADEHVVDQGFALAAGFLTGAHWSWLSFASIFLGAAEAAYEHVVATLPGRRNEGLGSSLHELPGVQQAVGEMRMLLDAARATLFAAAKRPITDPMDHYGRMAAAKLFVAQTAVQVCTLAMRTAGGSGYLRRTPLERLLRDAHAGLLLPPSHDATLQWVGKVELDAGAGP